ncbi:HAD family hydrolase [Salinisphaera sp. Q1T1-3]|nr:HAD family hydrolase [Salinisphaera sp. Q1T1-3]RJS91631.1 HAD family hydrolase [Salinisphaera sp. Q1T1-3]
MHLTFFDLDQTLLASDSDYEWNRFLVDEGVVDSAAYTDANDRFAAQYAAGELDIHAYQRFALAPLVAHGHEAMAALRERFVAERIGPSIARHAPRVLAFHRDRGDAIAIITATNAFVTEPIAAYLGISHLIATEPRIVDGRYTGEIAGTPSFQDGKIERALAFKAEYYPEAGPTTFYSDSHNDLPLLRWADRPVAVDPDPTLEAAASAAGWPIVSFRGETPPPLS